MPAAMFSATIEKNAKRPRIKDAIKASNSGDYDLANEVLTALLEGKIADYNRVLFWLGLNYHRAGNHTRAIDFLEELIESETSSNRLERAQMNLGSCHLALCNLDTAEEIFHRLLDSKDVEIDALARLNLANVRSVQGESHEALDWLEQAIDQQPELRETARDGSELESLRAYVRFQEIVADPACDLPRGWIEWTTFCVILVCMLPVTVLFGIFFQLAPRRLKRPIRRYFTFWRGKIQVRDKMRGFNIGAESVDGLDSASIHDQLDAALGLLERVDSELLDRIQSELDWIVISQMDLAGAYDPNLGICYLGTLLFGDPTYKDCWAKEGVWEIASTIVHEACHARLSRLGVRTTPERIHRIEQLCRKQQQRFICKSKRLNDGSVPASYDVGFFTGYGLQERWQYSQRVRFTIRERIRKWLSQFGNGGEEQHSTFLEHLWSYPRVYAEYTQELRRSITDDGLDACAKYVRGSIWSQLRRYADATSDLQKCVQLDGENAYHWYRLGCFAWHDEQKNLAHHAFCQALAIEPDNETFLAWQIDLLDRLEDPFQEAIGLAERLVAINPQSHHSFIRQSKTYLVNGKLERARQIVEQVLDYHPECLSGLELAVRICEAQSSKSEADEYLQAYVEKVETYCSNFLQGVTTQGVVLDRLARPDGAYLQVLVGMDSPAVADLELLGEQLIRRREKTSKGLEDDYYHSLLKPSMVVDAEELPAIISNQPGIYLINQVVTERSFIDLCVPELLEPVKVRIDRATPGNFWIGM